MRTAQEIRERIHTLERLYDEQDPPSSSMEDEVEVLVLRSIDELEWVLDDSADPPSLPE